MKKITISNFKNFAGRISLIFAFVFAFSLVASTASAQYRVQTRMGETDSKFGIKGGINISNFHGGEIESIDDDNMKIGLAGGLFAKVAITPFFAVQPEVLYSNRGSGREFGDNFAFGSGGVKFNMHYIEVPVLGVVNLGRNFNIHAGPYVAYLLGANVRTDSDDDGFRSRFNEIERGNFNAWDYGVTGGIGIDLFPVQITGRYLYGLNNIGKDNSIASDVSGDARHSLFQITLGLGL